MPAIELSGSVAGNWKSKRMLSIERYARIMHMDITTPERGAGVYRSRWAVIPAVSLLWAILPFLPSYGKACPPLLTTELSYEQMSKNRYTLSFI